MSSKKRPPTPEQLGRASMMATDILNGCAYHTDQVRDVLARAYIDLLQMVSDYSYLHSFMMEVPVPVTTEDWLRTYGRDVDGWPRCAHGVMACRTGKVWCTRCLHDGAYDDGRAVEPAAAKDPTTDVHLPGPEVEPRECIHGVGLCTGSCEVKNV